MASATPSSTPIHTIVKPIELKYKGITGNNISLDTSLSKLTIDSIKMLRVIRDKK